MEAIIYAVLGAVGLLVFGVLALAAVVLVVATARIFLVLLPYAAAIALLVMLFGCGEAPAPLEVRSDVSEYDLAWTQQVIADVEVLSGAVIDTEGMVVHYVAERNPADCVRASPIALGCTTVEDATIHVGAVDGQAFTAFILAHELGHNWYYQSEGYSDTHHEHTEWFDESDPESVVDQIFMLYR